MTITGGLDLWPADPAIPKADYTESLTAEGVPFELLDAHEVMRRWPQWRLDDGTTAMFQAQGGLADPFKGNAAHLRLATERGATLQDRTPVTAIRQVGGEVEVDAGGTTHRAGHVVVAADAWTNELLAPFGRRAAADDHQGAGHVPRRPRPGGIRTGSVPGLDLDGRPVFYGFPTYGEAGPKAAQDCRWPADDPRDPHLRTRRGRPSRASATSWPRTCPAPSGPTSTPRPASTP